MLHRISVHPDYRRALVLLLVGLGLALYVSQVVVAWHIQETEAAHDQAFRSPRSSNAWRVPQTASLVGENIAAGAVGTLHFNPYDPIGVLSVQDMPVLPPDRAYQLWCIDITGRLDPATVFTVPIDSDVVIGVRISTPRIFHTYIRYKITIEPAGGSDKPTGPVVMVS